MARRFTLVTNEYQDYDTDLIGVAKDAQIWSAQPTWNYGGSTILSIGGNNLYNAILEIRMPSKDDVLGMDEIESVILKIYQYLSGIASSGTIIAIEIPDDWTEGILNGAIGECSWDDAKTGIPWSKGSGAIISAWGALDSSESPIDSAVTPGVAGAVADWLEWDLTKAFKIGDRKTIVLFMVEASAGAVTASCRSTEYATAAYRPILEIVHRDYSPEGFEGDESLAISPNPDDHEQPVLSWGAVKSTDFSQYKLYRDTSDFSSVDDFKSAITVAAIATDKFTIAGEHGDAFPVGSTFKVTGSTGNDGRWTVASVVESGTTIIETVEDITDATADGDIHHGIYTSINPSTIEFIDTYALVDGTDYYYKIIAEDQQNHEDDALLSASVLFTKPDVTSGTMTRTDLAAWTGSVDVGTSVTMTVISPQNIKRIYVDWKDGVTSWYEFETVGVSKTAVHIYVQDSGGAVTPDVRVEDELGFWSDLTAGANTVDVDDTTPVAKLIVSAKEAIVGDDITLNATYSQPAGSNVTITKYEFKRDAADSYQDNGTDPIYTFDSGTYPNSVGTKTATVRITTSTTLTDTDTATYDLVTGTPTEITPGVSGGLSNATSIHDLQHKYPQNKMVGVPIGAAGTAKEFRISRPPQKFTIHASTEWPNMGDDLDIIRSAWESNTYLRLEQETEDEDYTIQYDFMLEGDVTVGHQFQNKLNWSFPVRVINRTKVAKLPTIQAITAFANPGGGKVSATSNGHGLLAGQTVLIRGTTNYNGTYVISVVTVNAFRFVATWVANDAMGTWAKVGES